MARRLPDDPAKRRLQVFKRCYQHLSHWAALIEDRGMGDVITTPEGEDIYLHDLLTGIDSLPRRQREAFQLICLQGYTETAARDEMLPNSRSSTPVQQYADSGLIRMVDAYDAKQAGCWPPSPFLSVSIIAVRMTIIMAQAALHPLVKQGLEASRKKILAEIDSLNQALQQVESIMSIASATAAPAAPAAPANPAPNPKPEGKPSLADAAKELAATG